MKLLVYLESHFSCMTKLKTCNAAGGTISLWINVIDCQGNSGIISTAILLGSGLTILFDPYASQIRYIFGFIFYIF